MVDYLFQSKFPSFSFVALCSGLHILHLDFKIFVILVSSVDVFLLLPLGFLHHLAKKIQVQLTCRKATELLLSNYSRRAF